MAVIDHCHLELAEVVGLGLDQGLGLELVLDLGLGLVVEVFDGNKLSIDCLLR